MALNIKDPETDRLARELADRMGTSITEALRSALKERLARTGPRIDLAYSELIEIGERGRARTTDRGPATEGIEYDDNGLPA